MKKWKCERLGEVASIDTVPVLPTETPNKQFFYIALENIEPVTGRLVGETCSKGVEIKSNKFRFGKEHVLLGKLRPYLNKVYLPDKPGICSTDILPLKPNPDLLAREFLAWTLRSPEFVAYSSAKMEGGKMPRLRTCDLEAFEIPVPPLEEQRRIVGRIEALTARLTQAQQARQAAIAEAETIEMAYLQRIRRLGIERSWNAARLGEIATVIMGQSPKGDTYNLTGHGVALLNGPTEFGEEHPTPRQWTTHAQRKCEVGDILFCVRGATTGRMNWADQTYCLGRGLAAIRPNLDVCLPMYLYGFLKTQAEEILHQGEGSVFPNFNKDQLSRIQIVLPPLAEQQKIVAELKQLRAKLDELRRLQREVEAELGRFVPALLAKAFRGEL